MSRRDAGADEKGDLATEIWLEALKIAEKKVGNRVKSKRISRRQQALLEVAALAGSPEVKEEARKRVLARQSPKQRSQRGQARFSSGPEKV